MIRIGTSGWIYRHWVGGFYPHMVRAKDRFAHYASRFDTVEINGSFYRLPSEKAVAAWAAQAPPGFLYAWKASRFITHNKKLKDVAASIELVFGRMAPLGDHFGPVLFQLPPQLRRDLPRLADFLALLPKQHRHTIEFRHPSCTPTRSSPSWPSTTQPSASPTITTRRRPGRPRPASSMCAVMGRAAATSAVIRRRRSTAGPNAWRAGAGRGATASPISTTTSAAPPRSTPPTSSRGWAEGTNRPSCALARRQQETSMRTTIFLGVAAAALALSACEKPGGQADQTNKPVNVAQDSAGAATGLATAAVASLSSGAFVNDAAIGDMYEIEAAKIALKRSSSAEVKSMAQMILTDHTAASEKLKALVSSGQVKEALPTAMDERRKGLLDNLNGSGGPDFDGRYIKQQIAAHHEAWTMMNGYKTAGQDPALKAFAAEVEPKIQMHLEMSQKLGGEAVGHTGSETAPPAKPAG